MRYADKSFVSNPGSPIHVLYSASVGKNGLIELRENGKENTDDIINSFAALTDMRMILNRVNAGEFDLLSQREGMYGDFTKMPKTYAEMLQLQIDANNMFDRLPDEIKKKFDHDNNQFFAQAGSLDWFEKMESVLSDDMKATLAKLRESASVQPVQPIEKEVSE